MTNLIPISELVRGRNSDFRAEGIYDPIGCTCYGANGEKVGKVDNVLAEPSTGHLRYLVVDVGGWFTNKEVLVPIGLARIEENAVYCDTLTKEQVQSMREFHVGDSYPYDAQISDERLWRGQNVQQSSRNAAGISPIGPSEDFSTSLGPTWDTMTTGTASDVSDWSTSPGTGAMSSISANDSAVSDTTGIGVSDVGSKSYNYHDDDATDPLFKTPERLRLLEEHLFADKNKQ